jgi:hypothetical protein
MIMVRKATVAELFNCRFFVSILRMSTTNESKLAHRTIWVPPLGPGCNRFDLGDSQSVATRNEVSTSQVDFANRMFHDVEMS